MIPVGVWDTLRADGRTFSMEVIAAQKTMFAELLGEVRAAHVRRDVPYGLH